MTRVRRLTAQQAADLWARFFDAHGPEVMNAAYGWESHADARPAQGERVWAFYDDPPGAARGVVGWGAVELSLRDPDDDTAMLIVGVFPEHQRKGYRRAILDWLCMWALDRGAKTAKMIVFKDNEAQYERTMREAYMDGNDRGWVHAGDVWYPAPGYGIFLRDLAPERETCEETTPSSAA